MLAMQRITHENFIALSLLQLEFQILIKEKGGKNLQKRCPSSLVEFLESDHWGNFTESTSRNVKAVFTDKTRSATSDTALTEATS